MGTARPEPRRAAWTTANVAVRTPRNAATAAVYGAMTIGASTAPSAIAARAAVVNAKRTMLGPGRMPAVYFRSERGARRGRPGQARQSRARCESAPPSAAASAAGAEAVATMGGRSSADAASAVPAHAIAATTIAPARLWTMPPWVKRYRSGRRSKARAANPSTSGSMAPAAAKGISSGRPRRNAAMAATNPWVRGSTSGGTACHRKRVRVGTGRPRHGGSNQGGGRGPSICHTSHPLLISNHSAIAPLTSDTAASSVSPSAMHPGGLRPRRRQNRRPRRYT